jgi:hypothetical protein
MSRCDGKNVFFQPGKRMNANSLPLCIIYFKEMQIATSDYCGLMPNNCLFFLSILGNRLFYPIQIFTVFFHH